MNISSFRLLLPARLRKGFLPALCLLLAVLTTTAAPQEQTSNPSKRKVLFVLTSHDKKGDTGEPTGFYLSEAAHPWEALVNAGYEIDFMSPQGGKAPVDGFDLSDPVNKKFWENPTYRHKIEHTKKPSDIAPADYVAIHFAGGHGAMWDFPENVALAKIAAAIYENNGVVSAVCHGPAGLINIKLSNDRYLVDGRKINAFTNEEEVAVKLDRVVPFLLESKLIERGAIFEKSAAFQPHVVTDQRLVTGQNPQSATAVGEAVVKELQDWEPIGRLTRYEIKPSYEEKFRNALKAYVAQALADEDNIQAEAYQEQGKPLLWLIERWKRRADPERFSHSAPAAAVASLTTEALSASAETFYIKDLAPLSKQDWRRVARKEDQPLTVMLFVDAKEGTQDDFVQTYRTALPPFRGQPGVVTYQLSQVKGDGTKFVTYEKFRSPRAFQSHLQFPPVKPVLEYLQSSIKKQPFQAGLHTLIEFAPLTRE